MSVARSNALSLVSAGLLFRGFLGEIEVFRAPRLGQISASVKRRMLERELKGQLLNEAFAACSSTDCWNTFQVTQQRFSHLSMKYK